MKWRMVWILVGMLILVAHPGYADSGPLVRINDLIEQASGYDGKSVTIEGEVIGDVMVRGASGWINVSDGTNDIGVWAPAEALWLVTHVGRYHSRGDRVRITGEFRRADPEQGGDLTLRAADLTVLEPGGTVGHPVRAGRPLLALIALGVSAVLGLVRWRTRAAG